MAPRTGRGGCSQSACDRAVATEVCLLSLLCHTRVLQQCAVVCSLHQLGESACVPRPHLPLLPPEQPWHCAARPVARDRDARRSPHPVLRRAPKASADSLHACCAVGPPPACRLAHAVPHGLAGHGYSLVSSSDGSAGSAASADGATVPVLTDEQHLLERRQKALKAALMRSAPPVDEVFQPLTVTPALTITASRHLE